MSRWQLLFPLLLLQMQPLNLVAQEEQPAETADAEAAVEEASPSVTLDTAADEQAIRDNAAAFVESFNRRDSRSIAAQWSPEAVYLDPTTGEGIVGREAIADCIDYDFAGLEDAELSLDIESIEFLSPNVAIEKGISTVKYSEHPEEVTSYSVVYVKREGKWLIDRVSEEMLPEPPPSNYEHLKDLEWMIGTWVDDSDDATVETECSWTKNKNFMTRAFAVKIGDQIDLSGVQIVGWDAAEEQVRSWVFDSDGGFAEATWTKEDDRWTIHSAGTLPTGEKSSAINVVTKKDDDSFTWQSTGRQVGGELQPNLPEVLIVRKTANGVEEASEAEEAAEAE